ncbi:MAG TPA: D-arabinono-1,4-lactone oxidase [Polyangiaceae bacterium]|nr:D-arabinono-1,4-lactone oxidase [Polyangiaceae bacterium]
MPNANLDHDRAIAELAADPADPEKAQKVFDLARDEPLAAEQARARVAPTPLLIPLDIERLPFHRHNLSMPQTPKVIADPLDLPALVATVQRAADAWLQIKAIGDGYGFANTGETRGYLLPMVDRLNRVLELDSSVFKDSVDVAHLCRFEAGATIQTINDYLWPRGKALLNQPGYERLTFVGTMSSGGHGSGAWCGPLSEHVRALHIVTVDANRRVVEFQIEPSDGISDPAKFSAKNPGVELVQDDTMFHACAVAMGCLGVIYSVTIQVRDAYNVRETRRKFRFSELKPRLPELIADQGPGKRLHSIEVWINPYQVQGDVFCVLGERSETQDPPRGERALVVEYGGPEFLYRLLSWWMAHEPSAVPTLVDVAMTATQASNVVLPAPKGLNFGAPNLAPVTACSCAVPSDGIGELADDLIAFFQQRAKSENSYITSPLGLRFVKAASAHLSPAFERDTCMIEVPTLLGTPKARETLNAYHDFLFEKYNGRPHWGQVNDMPKERLKALYPKLSAFLESFRVLNPGGLFDNAFTEQMGFRAS